jgi:hypothetical protein
LEGGRSGITEFKDVRFLPGNPAAAPKVVPPQP